LQFPTACCLFQALQKARLIILKAITKQNNPP
jgi:hypothetical protein